MYSFGAGVLYGVPAGANATPVRFGALQDVSVDFSFNVKELHGGSQFSLAIARGTGKVSCKAKAATVNGATFNSIFFGQTMTTGATVSAIDENASVPALTTFEVVAANAATFIMDLGVQNAETGLWMVKVASAPTTGMYSCDDATGTYTFAAADASVAVRLNYQYTKATGKTITLNNQLLGTTPYFQAVFSTSYAGKNVSFSFPNCTSSKMTFATKLEDYVIPEFDFAVFANAANQIGVLSFDE
jgi:hypothetical protein